MLQKRFAGALERSLAPKARFRPYPTAEERARWEALPADLRAAVAEAAAPHESAGVPALPATLFMDYKRTGNRSRFEAASFGRRRALAALVAAECCAPANESGSDAGGRLDGIVDLIWAMCEESFWGVPAHNPHGALPDAGEPIIDLFAAETGADLALAVYLLRSRLDAVSPRIVERVEREIERRIITPFLERDDFWWMGLWRNRRMNNWNPWILSNILAAGLLTVEAEPRRRAVVDKALRCLDRFLEDYPQDGGCDEGTSYWGRAGASLFDALDWLHLATDGAFAAWDEPLIAEIGRFIARAHIDGDYFINFADGGARVQIPAERVYSYGLRIGDNGLSSLGAFAYRRQSERRLAPPGPLARLLPTLFVHKELVSAAGEPPYLADVWLPETQVMVAREQSGTAAGLYLAAKGGHNAESHNHNDVGQFILYCDGQPTVIDLGVETYSAKTFSGRRYEIWTMRSSYHNLPDIDGYEQSPGGEARSADVSYAADAQGAEFSLELAKAYPQAESLRSWRRTLRLVRSAQPEVVLVDAAEFERSATVALNLMCWGDCSELAPGRFALGPGGRVELAFDAGSLAAVLEAIPIEDGRLATAWGERVYRLRLTPEAPVTRGHWRLVFRKVR